MRSRLRVELGRSTASRNKAFPSGTWERGQTRRRTGRLAVATADFAVRGSMAGLASIREISPPGRDAGFTAAGFFHRRARGSRRAKTADARRDSLPNLLSHSRADLPGVAEWIGRSLIPRSRVPPGSERFPEAALRRMRTRLRVELGRSTASRNRAFQSGIWERVQNLTAFKPDYFAAGRSWKRSGTRHSQLGNEFKNRNWTVSR